MCACARVCALAAALLVAAAAERPRRADMSPVPFVLGSRYGRSPDRVMAPRNDRFFMGSRYGKRSGAGEGVCAGGGCLLCRPAPGPGRGTGPGTAPTLYTCVPVPRRGARAPHF